MDRRTLVALVLLAAPLLAVTGGTLYVAANERSQRTFFSSRGPRNSAEAAAMGNGAAMMQFLRVEGDPTRVYPVRAEIISSQVQRATTLEAALWSRREEFIHAFDREGMIVDAEQRRYLACLATDLKLPAIAEYLAPALRCIKGDALRRVIARSLPGDAGPR
jgi:hypothetical protein